MDIRQFHRRLSDASRGLIPDGGGVLCGLSGGADSMALWYGLQAVNEIHDCGWVLRSAHLDHGLRAGSAADAEFVRQAVTEGGGECTVKSVDVATAARTAGETIEAAGRRLRYEFLESTAQAKGGRLVAVGHQSDDQAETVLHHIIRGTGLRGLAGMSPSRPIRRGSDVELVRPLLAFRRSELRAYLDCRGMSYRDDPTNADEGAATRNRIRHQILPLLAQALNPEITTALLRLSGHARRAEEVVAAVGAEALSRTRIRRSDSEVVLSAEAVAGLQHSIRTQVVLLVLRDLDVGLREIGNERIEAAAAVASGDGGRRLIELAGGVTVERRGRELRFRVERSTGSGAASRTAPAEGHCL